MKAKVNSADPCPHCGCEDIFLRGFMWMRLECGNMACGMRTPSVFGDLDCRILTRIWNRRRKSFKSNDW